MQDSICREWEKIPEAKVMVQRQISPPRKFQLSSQKMVKFNSFKLLLLLIPLPSVESNVSLNLKSSFLSDLLGKRNEEGEKKQLKDSSFEAKLADVLQLDVSGQINVHAVGPTSEEGDRIMKPLWLRPPSSPSVVVGAQYDFSEKRYGVKRLLTKIQWNLKGEEHSGGILPSKVELVGEQGLPLPLPVASVSSFFSDPTADQAGEVALLWGDQGKTAAIRARKCKNGDSRLSIALPLMRRVRYKCMITNESSAAREQEDPSISGAQSEWWIPDIRVNPAGSFESHNEGQFRFGGKSVAGISFSLRRRINFGSVVGGFGEDRGEATFARLDLRLKSDDQLQTTLSVETELERPLETAMVLVQNRIQAEGELF